MPGMCHQEVLAQVFVKKTLGSLACWELWCRAVSETEFRWKTSVVASRQACAMRHRLPWFEMQQQIQWRTTHEAVTGEWTLLQGRETFVGPREAVASVMLQRVAC